MTAEQIRRKARWLWPVVFAAGMVAAAEGLHQRAVIFPEGAALAFGIGTLALPAWTASPLRVALLPPAAATAGVVLATIPIPVWSAEIAALAVALCLLRIAGSQLIPAVSAAILPSVFAIHSWLYPMSVLGLSLVLASWLWWRARPGPRSEPPVGADAAGGLSRTRRPIRANAVPWSAIATAGTSTAVWIAFGGGLAGLHAPAFAPPMFVSVLEWAGRRERPARSALVRWAELIVAAGIGIASVQLIPVAWVAAAAAVSATVLVVCAAGEHNPPALAVALIPQLARNIPASRFLLGVTIGASALYLLTWMACRAYDAAFATPTSGDGSRSNEATTASPVPKSRYSTPVGLSPAKRTSIGEEREVSS